MIDLRRRRAAALAVLPVWLTTLVVLAGAGPASAGTVTTPTSCTNNAQPGTSALSITVSGSFTPSAPAAGDTVTLTGATFGIAVPSSTLLAGYGLGLLTAGVNTIPGKVNLTLLGTGTQQPSQTLGPIDINGTTTITDPTPANKTSGDETATPLSVTANIPTSTWTATGSNVALSLGTSSTSASVGPGGIITVTFSCTPGTPSPSGCGPAPAPACTGTTPVPAQPFASSGSSGSSSTSSSSSSSSSSTSSSSTSSSSTSTSVAPSTTATSSPTSTTAGTNAVPTEVTGTASYASSCRNSATPDISELIFEATGRTVSPVTSGGTASLTNQSWKVTVPASVLQTGIGLGLLRPGDTVAGVAKVTVSASNTREGTRTVEGVRMSIGPIAAPGGTAQPATTTFAVPDMAFTTVGGDVAFRMAATSVEVTLGPVKVTFTCEPKPPVATIVTAAVRGAPTGTAGPTQVAGVSTTRSGGATLARTGPPPVLVNLVIALGLLDLGYLCWSAARPARRRGHSG